MRYPSFWKSWFSLFIVLSLMGGESRGATFVALDDAQLADAAPLIVEARVLSRELAPSTDRPAIDYLIEIETLFKGFLPGSALVVRLPGGVLNDGRALHLAGVPSFAEGDRLLLFLAPRRDGTFTLHEMALGAFRFDTVLLDAAVSDAAISEAAQLNTAQLDTAQLDTDQAESVLWRDLSEAHQLRFDNTTPLVEQARRTEDFRIWLRDHLAGNKRPADYLVALPDSIRAKAQRKFRHIVSSTEPPPLGCGDQGGHRVRWFEFDRGGSVPIFSHRVGQPGLPQTSEVLKQALDAWNQAAKTRIRYQRGGETLADAGLTEFDGVNTLLFEDPNGEISGRFEGTGFLALGGPWFSCDLVEYRGEMFHPIFGADIITQDGLVAFFEQVSDPMAAAEELFAHELGHTLGLAHSEEPEALMFADLHADGRGASFDADDLAAVQSLYGDSETIAPLAPTNLWAAPLDSGRIRLTWQDNATDETGFRVDLRLDGTFIEIPVALQPNTRELNISGLEASTEYTFRVRAVGDEASSTPSNIANAKTLSADSSCTYDENRLCLLDGRFEVQVRFRNQHEDGVEGVGRAVPGTPETGLFWFFSPENIELTVKILDGTSVNGHYWVIYGALSDIEYWIEVTDHTTGEQRTYHNPPGEICGKADNLAFPATAFEGRRFEPVIQALSSKTLSPSPASFRLDPLPKASAEPTSSQLCESTNERLCLLDGRFSVEVEWLNQHDGGREGFGRAIAASENSGYFWFFSPNNLELAIKILDGHDINGNFWVFYGALSDVEYRLRVTDLATGASRIYHNPPGEICGRADIAALVSP